MTEAGADGDLEKPGMQGQWSRKFPIGKCSPPLPILVVLLGFWGTSDVTFCDSWEP